MVKIFVVVGLFAIGFSLFNEIRNESFNQELTIAISLGAIALTGLLYFVNTRKRIDYDDIKQVLYIVDTKNQTEIEIPVEKIDKILYSLIGFGIGNYSYVIIYRDFQNQKQKIRLFPIPFDNSIDTIKADAKLKNSDLVIRNWSIGWNELFDKRL